MNTILFLVYLAEVSQGVSILCFIAFGAIVLALIFLAAGAGMDNSFDEYWPILKKGAVWLLVTGGVAALMPSKSVLYLAAGMRAGQEIAQTDIGQKAYRLLDKKLDELLNEGDKK